SSASQSPSFRPENQTEPRSRLRLVSPVPLVIHTQSWMGAAYPSLNLRSPRRVLVLARDHVEAPLARSVGVHHVDAAIAAVVLAGVDERRAVGLPGGLQVGAGVFGHSHAAAAVEVVDVNIPLPVTVRSYYDRHAVRRPNGPMEAPRIQDKLEIA